MNKLYRYIISFCVLSILVIANPIDDKASQFVYEGAPISKIIKDNQYIIKKNYAIIVLTQRLLNML